MTKAQSALRNQILDLLDNHGPLRVLDIGRRIDAWPSDINDMLHTLLGFGDVRVTNVDGVKHWAYVRRPNPIGSGLTAADIAGRIGCGTKAVRRRIKRYGIESVGQRLVPGARTASRLYRWADVAAAFQKQPLKSRAAEPLPPEIDDPKPAPPVSPELTRRVQVLIGVGLSGQPFAVPVPDGLTPEEKVSEMSKMGMRWTLIDAVVDVPTPIRTVVAR